VRGDLYLEITYFANTPAPQTAPTNLSVPLSSGLMRRPSKLSPSDRLYRPTRASPPPVSSHKNPRYQGQGNNASAFASDGTHLIPPSPSSSRSSSATSFKRSESPLPPLPEERFPPAPLPNTLVPGGGGAKPRPQENHPPQVPSILRPGSNKPSHTSGPRHEMTHARHPSGSPPPPRDDYYAYSSSPTVGYNTTSPRPLAGFPKNATPVPAVPYVPPISSTPQLWATNPPPAGPMLFPIPTVAPVQESVNYQPSAPAPEQQTPYFQRLTNNGLPDPYLQVRYQTPLPLPPGSTSPPRGRQYLPRQNIPDSSRVEAIRLAEEEAARRKEQEDKDLELALQLDRELNLADQQSTQSPSITRASAPMPGGW
jgi:hypothetical protein